MRYLRIKYLFIFYIMLFIVCSINIVNADIKLDIKDINTYSDIETLDTEGIPIFTDYSLQLREQVKQAEEAVNKNIMSTLFSGNNVFGKIVDSKEDQKAEELFAKPEYYKKSKKADSIFARMIIYVVYLIATLILIIGSIKLTKKMRKRFIKGMR